MKNCRAVQESPEQKASNDLELAAWNEWKDVCSILGCSLSHRDALQDRMWKYNSRKKLRALLEDSYPNWEDELTDAGWRDEISKRFDQYIREGTEDKTGKRLNYKDAIWNIIENNPDPDNNPPLKVIRGKLTGSKRVLDHVLEKLVQEKGWTPKVIDHKPIRVVSANRKIGMGDNDSGDDAPELIDTIAAPISDSVEDDDRAHVAKLLRDTFSFEESVLLMAYFKRVSCASPLVRAASGFAKSKASEMLYGKTNSKTGELDKPGILKRFECCLRDIRDIARGAGWSKTVAMLLNVLQKRIRAEKRGAEFLKGVEDLCQ